MDQGYLCLSVVLSAALGCSSTGAPRDATFDARAPVDGTAEMSPAAADATSDAAPGDAADVDASALDAPNRDGPAFDADAGDAAPDLGEAGNARADGRGADAGSAALYRPCPPPGKPCAIMPLGDSITYGFDSSTGGGYRLRLLHDLWAANHEATFVGDGASGPNELDGRPFPRANEGFSGYTIDPAPTVMRSGLSPLVPAALEKYAPAVVTLMIGTNDVGTNNDLRNAPARLANLIDVITTTSPKALLIVAQLTPIGDDTLNPRVQSFNAALPALVQSRAAAGKHVLLVDMYSAFAARATYRTDYLNGALHPNDAGYDLMGEVWFAALAPHL